MVLPCQVEEELNENGRILRAEERRKFDEHAVGPGARSLDNRDVYAILLLYFEEASRSLRSYREGLICMTGTVVSKSTISRLFKESFPYCATLCRANMVPIDKFRPENQWRAAEYFRIIAVFDPYRIKFGDEKHLKGKEVFNRRNRRNPFTGHVPPTIGTPDLTNTYSGQALFLL